MDKEIAKLISTLSFEDLQEIRKNLPTIMKDKNSNYPDIPGWKRTIQTSIYNPYITWKDPDQNFSINCYWSYYTKKQKYYLHVGDYCFRSGTDINLLVNWREELELFKSQLKEEGFTIIPEEYYKISSWSEYNVPSVMIYKPGTNPILFVMKDGGPDKWSDFVLYKHVNSWCLGFLSHSFRYECGRICAKNKNGFTYDIVDPSNNDLYYEIENEWQTHLYWKIGSDKCYVKLKNRREAPTLISILLLKNIKDLPDNCDITISLPLFGKKRIEKNF